MPEYLAASFRVETISLAASGDFVAPREVTIDLRISSDVSFWNMVLSKPADSWSFVISTASMAATRTSGLESFSASRTVVRTRGVPSQSTVFAGGGDFTGCVAHQFPFQAGRL